MTVGALLVATGLAVVLVGALIGAVNAQGSVGPATDINCGSVWRTESYHGTTCQEILDRRTILAFTLIPLGVTLAMLGAVMLLTRRLLRPGWWVLAAAIWIAASFVGINQWTTRVFDDFTL